MNCQEVESLLLSGAVADGALADHLAQCSACAELAGSIERLERAVRSLPAPPGAAEARQRFAAVLRERQSQPLRIFRLMPGRWAMAASIVLLLGGAGVTWAYLAHQHTRIVASAEAIDDLVEWNLRLAQPDSTDERHKLYADSADGARRTADQAPLTEDDRHAADDLMQTGALLADSQDPLAEADHFSQMADLLVSKMDTTARKSPKALDRLGQTYFLVVDKGICRNLERAEAQGVDTPERQKRMERIIQRNIQLQERLEKFLLKHPNAANHPHLRKALELHRRQARMRKGQQQQQQQP
jgi:hypothetical protein